MQYTPCSLETFMTHLSIVCDLYFWPNYCTLLRLLAYTSYDGYLRKILHPSFNWIEFPPLPAFMHREPYPWVFHALVSVLVWKILLFSHLCYSRERKSHKWENIHLFYWGFLTVEGLDHFSAFTLLSFFSILIFHSISYHMCFLWKLLRWLDIIKIL